MRHQRSKGAWSYGRKINKRAKLDGRMREDHVELAARNRALPNEPRDDILEIRSGRVGSLSHPETRTASTCLRSEIRRPYAKDKGTPEIDGPETPKPPEYTSWERQKRQQRPRKSRGPVARQSLV